METLVDRFMANPDFAERHEITVPAPPEVVWDVFHQEWPSPRLARSLFAVRNLIARVCNGHAHRDLPTSPGSSGSFILLAQERPSEVVHGLLGRWWTFGASVNLPKIDGPEKFLAFAEPGYAKAVVCMRFLDAPGGATRVITETRVTCTDDAARRSMGRYWAFIRPFSGLIRIVMLRSLAQRARRAPGSPRGGKRGSVPTGEGQAVIHGGGGRYGPRGTVGVST